MAEREGFEPPVPFRVRRFSRPEPSTTRPPLRNCLAFIIIEVACAAKVVDEYWRELQIRRVMRPHQKIAAIDPSINGFRDYCTGQDRGTSIRERSSPAMEAQPNKRRVRSTSERKISTARTTPE